MSLHIEIIGEKYSVNIELIKEKISFLLPEAYVDFLIKYGYGVISDYVNIVNPDKEFFKNNFLEYVNLWEWTSELQKDKVLDGFINPNVFTKLYKKV